MFRTPQLEFYCEVLECEIHAGTGHTEVVLRPIHKIPAKIADPADMRRQADFHPAADLPDCSSLAICMTGRLDDVETFSRFNKSLVDSLLAATKDRATSTKKG